MEEIRIYTAIEIHGFVIHGLTSTAYAYIIWLHIQLCEVDAGIVYFFLVKNLEKNAKASQPHTSVHVCVMINLYAFSKIDKSN